MPSLLSAGQKATIRKALRDVTDTFMVTPVRYHIASHQLDRWGEDQEDQQYIDVNFNVLEEAITEDNEIVRSPQGDRDLKEVKLSVNLEDLQDRDVITSDYKTIFNAEKDFFSLRGEVYKVIDIYFDGPLDEKNVLVVIEGELSKASIIPANNPVVGEQIPVDEIISGNLADGLNDLEQRIINLEADDILPIEDLPQLP